MIRGRGVRETGGFTIVEVVVAIVLLSVVVLSLSAAALYTARALRAASDELRAAEFLQVEMERLLALPYDALASGSRSRPEGTAAWTVVDSVAYRQITLVTHYAPTPAISEWDTVSAYRLKP
ncbi:MAG: prepilin-type N-terminal cleavage/methylation domain-containing protein [Gemmatimonadota bacterium]